MKGELILQDIKIGDSISVNGACLTAESINNNLVQFHVSHTTRERTAVNYRNMYPGKIVNLERAMSASGRFGGHIVTGHVDKTCKLIEIKKNNDDVDIEVFIDKEISPYIIEKGSVAVNGISLTVSKRKSSSFMVTVIPHTFSSTNLKNTIAGEEVNIEVDILSRYVIDSKKYI